MKKGFSTIIAIVLLSLISIGMVSLLWVGIYSTFFNQIFIAGIDSGTSVVKGIYTNYDAGDNILEIQVEAYGSSTVDYAKIIVDFDNGNSMNLGDYVSDSIGAFSAPNINQRKVYRFNVTDAELQTLFDYSLSMASKTSSGYSIHHELYYAPSSTPVGVFLNDKDYISFSQNDFILLGKCSDGSEVNCGSDVGVCEYGTKTCSSGAWEECVGAIFGTSVENNCNNGLDDDCDGLSDCTDSDCSSNPSCIASEICNNGIDDDSDTFIDCLDSDCSSQPFCLTEICNNGIDDDGDTFIDCFDSNCSSSPFCLNEICNNGIDDDGDTFIDCLDSNCSSSPFCLNEICNNGIDDDSDTFIDCLDSNCSSSPLCFPINEICNNGLDDDGDTFIDCFDTHCENNASCLYLRIYSCVGANILGSCGTVSSPGVYCLNSNINEVTGNDCIRITSSNVILNCQNHKITGYYNYGNGVLFDGSLSSNLTNVTLQNCEISNFNNGVYAEYLTNSFTNFVNNKLHDNSYGLYFGDYYSPASYLFSGSSNNKIYSNYYGLYVGSYAHHLEITGFNFTNSDGYSLLLYGSSSKIYNNYFDDSTKVYNGGSYNYFNTTLDCGKTSIVGGCIGGNFWADFIGTDLDGNKISEFLNPKYPEDLLPLTNVSGNVIRSCGTISSKGIYVLNSDISETSGDDCIRITSSNVILNCQNHKITGYYNYGNGVLFDGSLSSNLTNVTLQNCEISNFNNGVYAEYLTNSFTNFVNNKLHDNSYGLYFGDYYSPASYLFSGSSNNKIYSNYYGLYVGSYAHHLEITGFNFTNSDGYSLLLYGSSSKIYNNYFDDSTKVYNGGSYNYFNTTLDCGKTSIVGGCIGGNFWADFIGTDLDGNKISEFLNPKYPEDLLPLTNVSGNVIRSCGTISSKGIYVLNSDISETSGDDCIRITSSNVILNCQNHKITGYYNYGNGVLFDGSLSSNLTNVTLQNCEISNFNNGVYAEYLTNSFTNFVNNKLHDNSYGLYFGDYYSPASYLFSGSSNNKIYSNYYGLYVGSYAHHLEITGFNFTNSDGYSLLLYGSNNNVYNNYFDDRTKVYNGGSYNTCGTNYCPVAICSPSLW